MRLNGEVPGPEGFEPTLSPRIGRAFHILPTDHHIDWNPTIDEVRQELQALIFTFLRIGNLNRDGPSRDATPAQRGYILHRLFKELAVGSRGRDSNRLWRGFARERRQSFLSGAKQRLQFD